MEARSRPADAEGTLPSRVGAHVLPGSIPESGVKRCSRGLQGRFSPREPYSLRIRWDAGSGLPLTIELLNYIVE